MNKSVVLLSMQVKKTLEFHQNMNKVLQVWNNTRMSNTFFGGTIPLTNLEKLVIKASPATVITSAPWEREQDTAVPPLWQIPFLLTFPEVLLVHASPVDWPELARQYKRRCSCQLRQNLTLNTAWCSGSEHGDHHGVSLSGNRGYESNWRRSLSSCLETSNPTLRDATSICTSYTLIEDRTHTQFP